MKTIIFKKLKEMNSPLIFCIIWSFSFKTVGAERLSHFKERLKHVFTNIIMVLSLW